MQRISRFTISYTFDQSILKIGGFALRSRHGEMRDLGKLFLIILFISLFLYPSARATSGSGKGRIPTYTVSPALQQVNLNQSDQLEVGISGGQPNTKYAFNITVTKPDQASFAVAEYTLITDSNGSGTGGIPYPSGFRAGNAAPATDTVGIFEVRVDQSLPKYRFGVAASSFTVTSNLSLNILAPTSGTYANRGSNVSLIVLVDDVNGNPDSNASVNATLPGQQGAISIPESQQFGTFASTYRIRWSDPSGLWNINYRAIDASGNLGVASIPVNITGAALSIQALSVSDGAGQIRNTFYNNETVNFSLKAAYLDGSRVTSGAASIKVVDPNGRVVVTLALVYNPQIVAYQTPTGFGLNQTTLLGTWTATVSPDTLSDGFGNTGPVTSVSFQFSVAATPTALGNSQNPPQTIGTFSYLPILLLGAVAVAPIVLLKRRGGVNKDDDLDLLIQQAGLAEFVLIEGDKQTGKSTAVELITHRTVEKGGNAILLTFENSPADVRTRMTQFGVDWNEFDERGGLEIIDCSNLSESLNLGFVRSKLLNTFDSKSEPKAVFIDSLDLLYEELEDKEVQDLVLGLRAEVKTRNGTLYATATPGNVPYPALTGLENAAGMVLQAEKGSQLPLSSVTLKIKKIPERSKLSSEKMLAIGQSKS
jgi:archaellum biogenesis ATPase FlaH